MGWAAITWPRSRSASTTRPRTREEQLPTPNSQGACSPDFCALGVGSGELGVGS
jgi:hypothetical protein